MPLKMTVETSVRGDTRSTAEQIEFPVPCPHCGHEMSHSVARLESNPNLTCAACLKDFTVETSGAREAFDEIAKIDRAWDNLIKG
jgi:transcription elongation factor Elf1